MKPERTRPERVRERETDSKIPRDKIDGGLGVGLKQDARPRRGKQLEQEKMSDANAYNICRGVLSGRSSILARSLNGKLPAR